MNDEMLIAYDPDEQVEVIVNTYTVSARGKKEDEPIFDFLRKNFGRFSLGEIESVFGFLEKSTLYGGRQFLWRQLSDRDVFQLNNAGIGVRIPFTNHFATREEYLENKPLFAKYHNKLNSVIFTNDDLTSWTREDFPLYEIEASVIKNINTKRKLDTALEIYDTVVLPMSSNQDIPFLESIEDKSRIRLFSNAGCALTCPARICYKSVSELNKPEGGEFRCSQEIKSRKFMGEIDFDVDRLSKMGFHKFKTKQIHIKTNIRATD